MTQQSVNISNFESQSKSKKKSCGNKKIYIIGGVLICVCVLIGLLVAFLPVEDDSDESDNNPIEPIEPLPTGIRLPGTLVPISYEIEIQAFINDNFSTQGHVDITFEVKSATSYVILHMLDIVTVNESIKLISEEDPEEKLEFESHAYDLKKQFYIGTLTAPLKPENSYTISLDYIGYLNTEMDGFYRSVYEKDQTKTYLASTHFEATNARKAFPCFDEPELKATFKISLAREGMTSISNMPLEKSEVRIQDSNWVWDSFEITPKMSTYLVAFTISDFKCKEGKTNAKNNQGTDPTPIQACVRSDVLDKTDYALTTAPSILDYYEKYFLIEYALPKLDMLGIPDFRAGAMENWGLVTYREEALLYDDKLSSAWNKQRVGSVIAHELGHQWFGDLVTPAWWSDIWLNEGFATFMEYDSLNVVEPEFGMNDQFVVDELQAALSKDCLLTSHPISTQVQDPDEIGEIFDSISYSKGASVIRMMKYFLPEDTFQKGIQNYLKDLAYSSAVQDDLWDHMTEAAQENDEWEKELTVKEIMDTWTLQMGYPVVTVTRKESMTTITQERFLLNKSEASADDEYGWWIPLTYHVESSPDFNQIPEPEWMKPTEKMKELTNLKASDEWVIFNSNQISYYRVNYDEKNWAAIKQQLEDEPTVIGLLNRAQIIDDTLNLARGGYLPYETTLELIRFLENERDYVVWSSAMRNLYYLQDMFIRTAGYGSMKDFLIQLATGLYDDFDDDDFVEQPSDDHLIKLKRAAVFSWMCNLNYEKCIEKSVEQYTNFMADASTNPLSADLRPTVLCYGIAEGDEDEWDFAWNSYLDSDFAPEKDDLMSGMGCSKEHWLLIRYLDRTFKVEDSAIRQQDAFRVFNAVARNDYGRDIAWSYLKSNWDEMAAYYGSAASLGEYIASVTKSFNTEVDLNELLQLKEDHYAEFGNATQDFDQSIDNVKNNINWMNLYYDTINNLLLNNLLKISHK